MIYITIKEKDYSKYFTPDYKKAKERNKDAIKIINYGLMPTDLKIGKGKKYFIETYGCQMNVHDSQTIAGILEQMGYKLANDYKEADLILLNTCAIRENAEDKVFGHLGYLKRFKLEKPELILGVCGCMSQEENVVFKLLENYPYVDLIFGTHNIHRLPYLLKEAIFSKEMVVEVWSKEGDIVENIPKVRTDKLKAWVNIMYGCDKFCTYCIVPYTRGKERSRRPADILQELEELAAKDYKEVTLLGQNVNAYGKDFSDISYRFKDLMKDIKKIPIPRIRFTTSHPKDFDDGLIEVLATGGNLVEHIHLPVQSGNTKILKLMGRKYTREDYLNLVTKIKKAIPNVAITTDIIVGFPQETDEQFEDTLSLVKEVNFDSSFTFIYSKRDGTPAAKMKDNIPLEIKKERLQRLNTLQAKISKEKNAKLVNKIVEVLVEGKSKKNSNVLTGRTRTNKIVNFVGSENLIGKLVNIVIKEAKSFTLEGEIVND